MAAEAKLNLELCDASPAALCNAFRYNYGDMDADCTMLLDIGAKTSNLLFFEKGKVFSRSINLGANAITQDFANESKLKFDDAEKDQNCRGFRQPRRRLRGAGKSASGGDFQNRAPVHDQAAHPGQPDAAVLSRPAGRLGAARSYFCPAAHSIMPYTAQFFAEKLNVPVEYFNPFRNVQISPEVNLEELSRVAHSLGEVVGLGLRNLATCPVEMNLMPDSTLALAVVQPEETVF